MSTSERKIGTAAALALLALVVGACDDPTAERDAPLERQILMMLDLDPEADVQTLWVTTFDLRPPEDVVAELWTDGSLVSTSDSTDIADCVYRLNLALNQITHRSGVCAAFAYRPAHGETYDLVVRSRDRPTVTARTTVPGDFDILAGVVEGDPPGTETLDLTWTRADPTYRYLVFVMDLSYGGVFGRNNGEFIQGHPLRGTGWILFTADTAVSTYRPADEVWAGNEGDWVVAVYAVDQALYDFMTSGSNEGLFPVPPVSNLVNGYGFFGASVRKLVPLDSLPQS